LCVTTHEHAARENINVGDLCGPDSELQSYGGNHLSDMNDLLDYPLVSGRGLGATLGLGRAALVVAALILIIPPSSAQTAALRAPAPALMFTDLTSGPNEGGQDRGGVFVTLYGHRFGTRTGAATVLLAGQPVTRVLSWTDERIVVQLDRSAQSGDFAVIDAQGQRSGGVPFVVRPGRIRFVAAEGQGDGSSQRPMSPQRAAMGLQPGDTLYFRAGLYDGRYADQHWGQWNYALGPNHAGRPGLPVAFVGYPSELAVFEAPGPNYGNFGLRDGQGLESRADDIVIANLTLRGADVCIGGGGITVAVGEQAKSGAQRVRVVGVKCSARYRGNTMTGLLSIANDGWRVYGNDFHDTGTNPPINNNHAVYVVVGASDVDIGYNRFRNLKMGHVIQVHTDTQFRFDNVRIHGNVIIGARPEDCRGINIGHVADGSNGAIFNNVLVNLGQDFSGIAVYGGHWSIFNNTLYKVSSRTGMLWFSGQYGSSPSAEVFNNVFVSDGRSPYVTAVAGASLDRVRLSRNLYFGRGRGPVEDATSVADDPLLTLGPDGIPIPAPGSPVIDRGLRWTDSIAGGARDLLGTPRPQGTAFDLGAIEAHAVRLPPPAR
jgi:hypothetical protein